MILFIHCDSSNITEDVLSHKARYSSQNVPVVGSRNTFALPTLCIYMCVFTWKILGVAVFTQATHCLQTHVNNLKLTPCTFKCVIKGLMAWLGR